MTTSNSISVKSPRFVSVRLVYSFHLLPPAAIVVSDAIHSVNDPFRRSFHITLYHTTSAKKREGLFQTQNPNAQNGYRFQVGFHFEFHSFRRVLNLSAPLKTCPEIIERVSTRMLF